MKAAVPALPASLPFILSDDPTVKAVILVAALMIVAFFSHSAASVISYDKVKVRLRPLAKEGNPTARIVEQINGQPSTRCATIPRVERPFSSFPAVVAAALAPAQ